MYNTFNQQGSPIHNALMYNMMQNPNYYAPQYTPYYQTAQQYYPQYNYQRQAPVKLPVSYENPEPWNWTNEELLEKVSPEARKILMTPYGEMGPKEEDEEVE